VNLILLIYSPARDRNSASAQLPNMSITSQKLNQGKENRELKPPSSQSKYSCTAPIGAMGREGKETILFKKKNT
jgi:hypothetical protein